MKSAENRLKKRKQQKGKRGACLRHPQKSEAVGKRNVGKRDG